MPPQPEYVLIRDKARNIIYLASELYNEGKYELICFLTRLAIVLLDYSIRIRTGSSERGRQVINVAETIVPILFKNSKDEATNCLKEAYQVLEHSNKVFMERREEECECWGE